MSERGPSNTHKEATDSHICCNLFLESKGGFPPSKRCQVNSNRL